MPVAYVGAATAVAGLASSVIGGSSASGAISAGQQQANAELQPFVTQGTAANKAAADLAGLNGADAASAAKGDFQASPGYQYQVQQGLQAVDAGAAAKGMLRSGATLKAEQTLGSNLANQDYQQYINNLGSLSSSGINAAGGVASTDTSAAGNQASIYGNEAKGISNGIGGVLGNSGVQNGLSSLFGSSGSGTQVGTSGFGTGPGGGNSAGANTLQSLGFYTPLSG